MGDGEVGVGSGVGSGEEWLMGLGVVLAAWVRGGGGGGGGGVLEEEE